MTTHQEDEVLERLNEQDGPRGFFLEAVTILEEAVDSLMRRAFRQEEYAVKYAIEPLLNQSGPLGQLEVRLKLIFALGLISLERYQVYMHLHFIPHDTRLDRDEIKYFW